jgi:hypothetical protein
VKERGILFSAPMVRALLDGRKTQTRRIVKERHLPSDENEYGRACPYGVPGDRLWVRETWAIDECGKRVSLSPETWSKTGWPIHRLLYAADGDARVLAWNKRVSIHMPRWASRITLEVTDVRVQRLQDISEDDAKAEGYTTAWLERVAEAGADGPLGAPTQPRHWYASLWDEINGPGSWAANPWVWAISFNRVDGGGK